jgi:hypothetical protein
MKKKSMIAVFSAYEELLDYMETKELSKADVEKLVNELGRKLLTLNKDIQETA